MTALFPFNINAWYGLPAQGVAVDNFADDNFDHGAHDFIGGGNLWVMSDRRPIAAASMGTFGRTPTWGSEWKAFVNEERRSHQHVVPAEDDAAVRGQLPRSRSGGEGSARLPGVPHHRRLQGQRAARQRRSAQDKMDAVVQGRRRDRDAGESDRHDGPDHARLRRHAHGPQSRDERRQSSGASHTKCRTSACSARR